MSTLTSIEKRKLEDLLGMRSGYVGGFSNRTFAEFFRDEVQVDIYCGKYSRNGDSKANHLRAFWGAESDGLVGGALEKMIDVWEYEHRQTTLETGTLDLLADCRLIVGRLLHSRTGVVLNQMKHTVVAFDAKHLAEQITRMEQAVDTDPPLAIGTAKELVETCCRTILGERGKPVTGTPDVPALTREVLKELKLVPDGVPEQAKGSEIIKRLLSNLGSIGNGLAELRNLYGTGHGRDGRTQAVKPRHAKLAVGAATTLGTFLFETHKEM